MMKLAIVSQCHFAYHRRVGRAIDAGTQSRETLNAMVFGRRAPQAVVAEEVLSQFSITRMLQLQEGSGKVFLLCLLSVHWHGHLYPVKAISEILCLGGNHKDWLKLH